MLRMFAGVLNEIMRIDLIAYNYSTFSQLIWPCIGQDMFRQVQCAVEGRYKQRHSMLLKTSVAAQGEEMDHNEQEDDEVVDRVQAQLSWTSEVKFKIVESFNTS